MIIDNKKDLEGIRFGYLFRKVALNDNTTKDLRHTEKELFKREMHLSISDIDSDLLPENLKDVFFDNNSSQLLWLLKCVYDGDMCLLHKYSTYMKDISGITRGGLNIYKRAGWDVHVLYAYQLVCDNFTFNKSTCVDGAPTDFGIYNSLIKDLDDESLFILRISTFLHDIGVVDGVKDHEIKGVKWVEARYNELRFNSEELKRAGVKLSLEEIYGIIRFVVGNHQMMNQIGSEISDSYAYNKIENAINSLNGYGLEFFRANISTIMYLLSAADLMAVDDKLLTREKSIETKESFDYFKCVLENGFFERNYVKYGIQRFRSLLEDSKKDKLSDSIFNQIVEQFGFDSTELAKFIYHILQMSYAMTVIKPQEDYRTGIKIFCSIYQYVIVNSINKSNVKIKFDPDIDYYGVQDYVKNSSVNQIISEGKLVFCYDNDNETLDICYEV